MSNSEAKLSPREELTATTDQGKTELTEQELSRVGGGIIRRVGSAFELKFFVS
jgi:hypothetical protein